MAVYRDCDTVRFLRVARGLDGTPIMKNQNFILALYGRSDAGDNVLMFFRKRKHLREFTDAVPGAYSIMLLEGIAYDDFTVTHIVSTKRRRISDADVKRWEVVKPID